MTLLDGKRLVLTGVASPQSLAYATAARATALGAEVVLTAPPRDLDLARDCAATLPGHPEVLALDLTDPSMVAAVVDELVSGWGSFDGALHSVAFAPRPALEAVLGVEHEHAELAFRTSVHTYVVMADMLRQLAPSSGASLVGLDFDASRAWTTYNWMGVCKAALESANRYLARDLGPLGIRANLIAAGPLVTRAASAIPGFDDLLVAWKSAPLGWEPHDPGPVADAVCFLLSDMAVAITGEVLHVDGGHHAMAG